VIVEAEKRNINKIKRKKNQENKNKKIRRKKFDPNV
jgi:hypothetical protein